MDFSFFDQYSSYFLGLGAVLILIGALTWILQKLNLFGTRTADRASQASLKLLSSLQLDPKRRIVAVEFNRRKHLILLGNTTELLIESEDLTTLTGLYNSEKTQHPDTQLSSQKRPSASSATHYTAAQKNASYTRKEPPLKATQDQGSAQKTQNLPPLPRELRS